MQTPGCVFVKTKFSIAFRFRLLQFEREVCVPRWSRSYHGQQHSVGGKGTGLCWTEGFAQQLGDIDQSHVGTPGRRRRSRRVHTNHAGLVISRRAVAAAAPEHNPTSRWHLPLGK